ncbi:MAG TPA: Rossmann-like and DUF2520 domain-containing protein [Terriglobales bacterium]|nr:Rossmann-like and DUF2520 domain-containing protein [Terriglobales bacterium]
MVDAKTPDMLPAMAAKPSIAIVGPGRLGSALAVALRRALYEISGIVSPKNAASKRKAATLARKVRARVSVADDACLKADVIWFCVPDREIKNAAQQLAVAIDWKGKIAFHSSGALLSDELNILRERGAAVGSIHPMMTFVTGAIPSLKGVPFAMEGDVAAIRAARRIARDLGGEAFTISKQHKTAYHAWGSFASPLLVALFVTAEQVARAAGLSAHQARRKMLPIVSQTIANYRTLGPAAAFSGPIVRGDAEIVRKHLQMLRTIPEARKAYLALSQAAMRHLPARNRAQLKSALEG